MEWLSSEIDYGNGPRNRVRYPKQYERFDEIEINLNHQQETFVSSDLHFDHKNIIQYADRPFENKHEMNEALIERHNSVVTPIDNVIFLGDIAFCNDTKATKYVSRMNGVHKRLIVGNHDFQKKKVKQMGFQDYSNAIHLVGVIEQDDFVLVLTHFPMGNLPERDDLGRIIFNVHGHTHNQEEESIRHINVSVEHHDYTPINIKDIIRIAYSRSLEIMG